MAWSLIDKILLLLVDTIADISKNVDVYGRQVMSKLPVPMQVSVPAM